MEHLWAPETTEFVGAPVEVSFGWTTRPAGTRFTLDELVARSDRAMLEARDARRGRRRPGPGNRPGTLGTGPPARPTPPARGSAPRQRPFFTSRRAL